MFERIKRALYRDTSVRGSGSSARLPHLTVSEWAGTRGMTFSNPLGGALTMQGKVGPRSWRMELGRPTRDYISGEELRARAELGIYDDVVALIINRPLKEALERRAYSMITDTLQTTAEPHLPEEMRWLAMYDEIRWDGWAMLVGSGLSVWLLNWLYRMGVAGDEERDKEEAAREYFGAHGRWPDEDQ